MVAELKEQKETVKNLVELYEIDDYLWLQKTIKILATRELNNLANYLSKNHGFKTLHPWGRLMFGGSFISCSKSNAMPVA